MGGSVEQVNLNEEYISVALSAANILGMDIAGVDLLESKDGPLVLEVNSSPGLEGVEGASGVNVAEAVAQHLNNRIEDIQRQKKDEAELVNSASDESSVISD